MSRLCAAINPSVPTGYEHGSVAADDKLNCVSYRFFKKETTPSDIEDKLAIKFFHPSSYGLSDSERLKRFDEFRGMLAPEHQGKLRLDLSSSEQSWSYTFVLDDDILYQSDTMTAGDGEDLGLFKQHVLLQDILAALQSNKQTLAESDLNRLQVIARQAAPQYRDGGGFAWRKRSSRWRRSSAKKRMKPLLNSMERTIGSHWKVKR